MYMYIYVHCLYCKMVDTDLQGALKYIRLDIDLNGVYVCMYGIISRLQSIQLPTNGHCPL